MNEKPIDYAAFRRKVAESQAKQVYVESVRRLNAEHEETVAFLREQSRKRFNAANGLPE